MRVSKYLLQPMVNSLLTEFSFLGELTKNIFGWTRSGTLNPMW